jgi:hypothetical protein
MADTTIKLDLDALHRMRAEVDEALQTRVGYAGLRWRLPPSLPLGIALFADEGRIADAIAMLVHHPEWADGRPRPSVKDAVDHLLVAGLDAADLESMIETYGPDSAGKSLGSLEPSPGDPTSSPPTSPVSTASISPSPPSTR